MLLYWSFYGSNFFTLNGKRFEWLQNLKKFCSGNFFHVLINDYLFQILFIFQNRHPVILRTNFKETGTGTKKNNLVPTHTYKVLKEYSQLPIIQDNRWLDNPGKLRIPVKTKQFTNNLKETEKNNLFISLIPHLDMIFNSSSDFW